MTHSRFSSAIEDYQYLITHIVPGPASGAYFIPVLLLPIALLIPPSRLSHGQLCAVFLPLIFACQIYYWLHGGPYDTLMGDVSLRAFAMLAAYDPRRRFTRVRYTRPKAKDEDTTDERTIEGNGSAAYKEAQTTSSPGRKDVQGEPYPTKLSGRIPWVFTLLISLRFTGWKTTDSPQVRAQQQPLQPLSRSSYAKQITFTLIVSYLILDLSSFAARSDPYFHTPISIDTAYSHPSTPPNLPPIMHLLRATLPPRLLRASILAAQLYSGITILFLLPILPALGLNALCPNLLPDDWSPHTWPPLWGPISAIADRGVRGLWGTWWHDLMRQQTLPPGRLIANCLNLPRGSLRRYACLVTSAFFFSGLLHAGLVPPEPLHAVRPPMVLRAYIAAFFCVQTLAIGLETVVCEICRRWSPGFRRGAWLLRGFSAVWTAAWLAVTLPLLAVPFKEMRYWEGEPLPVSLSRFVLG